MKIIIFTKYILLRNILSNSIINIVPVNDLRKSNWRGEVQKIETITFKYQHK